MTVAPIHVEVDGVPATLPALSVQLPDGRTGWFQRSRVDCLRAAVATVVQVGYDELGEIPNLSALLEWAHGHGYAVDLHYDGPPVEAARWIGCSPRYEGGLRHTLVMAHDRVYHDPAAGWRFTGGLRAEPMREIEHGITIEPKETSC